MSINKLVSPHDMEKLQNKWCNLISYSNKFKEMAVSQGNSESIDYMFNNSLPVDNPFCKNFSYKPSENETGRVVSENPMVMVLPSGGKRSL